MTEVGIGHWASRAPDVSRVLAAVYAGMHRDEARIRAQIARSDAYWMNYPPWRVPTDSM